MEVLPALRYSLVGATPVNLQVAKADDHDESNDRRHARSRYIVRCLSREDFALAGEVATHLTYVYCLFVCF